MYLYPGFICCRRCFFDNWCICTALIFIVADAIFETNVSALPWYSLLQMLFLRPRYLQLALLWTCRCFSACLSCTIASTSCLFWDLKILPSQILHLHHTFSITWGCFSLKFCILNLPFQCFADTPHRNFASSISPNPLSKISPPPYPLSSIYFTTWANTLLTKNWYKKFERIWSERWRHLERNFL